jgi:hypothetical protein
MKLPPNIIVSGMKEGDEVVILTMPKPVSNATDQAAWPRSGDQIQFDDLSAACLSRPGLKFNVEPVTFRLAGTPAAREEANSKEFKDNMADWSFSQFAGWLAHSFKKFEAEHEAAAAGKKMPTRDFTMRTAVAVVLPKETAAECIEAFKSWVNGGIMRQVLPEVQKSYTSFADGLEGTPNPLCLMQERTDHGLGIDALLAVEATFQFHASENRWPSLGNNADAEKVLNLADAVSKARASAPNAGDLCHAQKFEYNFPQGEARDLDASCIRQFSLFFEAELVGFCSFLGGVVAQEAMKKIGKFTPISGWLIHEDHALVR